MIQVGYRWSVRCWISEESGFRCESSSRFARGRTASAGDVGAGAEIVVITQAISAEVDLMHAAVNHWKFGATQVAAAANTFRFFFSNGWGCGTGLQSTGLQVSSDSRDEGAECQQADAGLENAHVGMLTECRGQKAKPHQHEETSSNYCPAACLAHWDAFLRFMAGNLETATP
jgi:hypothetical protein